MTPFDKNNDHGLCIIISSHMQTLATIPLSHATIWR